jgi:transglutaminase-like putative cysteine protease
MATLVLVFCAGCAAPLHADQPRHAGEALETPDAVFELWEQDWTLTDDGAQVYHEKQHLRLNSDRVYWAFGDPRITYNADLDEVEVLEARTRLPSGEYVPLADYSTVEVAPDAAAGWPAFANLRQRVMVMGGIEPGCVLELEYKITTKAGVKPYMAADLRIDDRYPVRARTVTMTVPFGAELSPVVRGLPEDSYVYSFEQRSDGNATHRWDFAGLPGEPDEPQALPWSERGVRLAFTTAPEPDTWVKERLATIDTAADESPLLTKLAQEWTKDETSSQDKLSALQNKLAASFNFLDFDVEWRPAIPRRASDVIYHSYGLPAESAAILLALARAAGIAVQPALLVTDGVWEEDAPQDALVAAYVVIHDGPDGMEIWDPQDGRVRRDKHWAGSTLLAMRGNKITRTSLPGWRDPDESHCVITGNVAIAKDGKYTAKLLIKTTGLFVSPNDLESADGQKRCVQVIVDRLLPDAKVANFTLKSLTPEVFEAEAQVESPKALKKLHECYELKLAETSPALADVPVPCEYARRLTPARLVGPFDERIELAITWPEAWQVEDTPSDLAQSEGPWGSVSQRVSPTENGLKLLRHTRVAHRDLPPDAVMALRKPLNELRSDYARTLLLKP